MFKQVLEYTLMHTTQHSLFDVYFIRHFTLKRHAQCIFTSIYIKILHIKQTFNSSQEYLLAYYIRRGCFRHLGGICLTYLNTNYRKKTYCFLPLQSSTSCFSIIIGLKMVVYWYLFMFGFGCAVSKVYIQCTLRF